MFITFSFFLHAEFGHFGVGNELDDSLKRTNIFNEKMSQYKLDNSTTFEMKIKLLTENEKYINCPPHSHMNLTKRRIIDTNCIKKIRERKWRKSIYTQKRKLGLKISNL